MVRFSCFNAQINSHKPKKTAETSVGAMPKASQDLSQVQAPKTLTKAKTFNLPKVQADAQITDGAMDVTSCLSVEQSWKSDRIEDTGIHQRRLMKKCQSLGSGLCHEGLVFHDNTEEEIDQGFSSDSLDHHGLARPDGSKDTEISQTSQHEKAPELESVPKSSDFFNNECIFSIGDTLHSEKGGPENFDAPLSGEGTNGPDNFDAPLSGEGTNGSRNRSPRSPPVIVKSNSLPNIGPCLPASGRHSYEYVAPHSRSSEDLHALGMRWKEFSIHGAEMLITREEERDDIAPRTEENNFECCLDEGFDSYNYSASAKDWIMPVVDEVNLGNNLPGESSTRRWEELPSKDFKMKLFEDWVNNLQHHGPLEETIGMPDADDLVKRNSNDLATGKVENKVTPGAEAAKRYISSLSASATTAHLSNHGLAVIPFLSAFGSLRMLNLSGNSIVRITAGSLPRGLHMLNLSKNNISTIEGLRELTRLRVLDLSYNRIFRIGHGLASCSSLKELYMAGNKISEVEGLHRLLKLTVLDLRFNKISTAKCLGQLAANYNSLQAISLEGNPAQKNVGDEQLKKHLQGLLPHLVYFNRQPIKAGTLKDAADRSVRLGISTHQFDRGIRSDNKSARKASHGLAGARPASSSTHARKSQAVISPKRSRGRHVRLPPSGTKATTSHRHHYIDLGSKLTNLKSELAFHRSRSEGTLGAI